MKNILHYAKKQERKSERGKPQKEREDEKSGNVATRKLLKDDCRDLLYREADIKCLLSILYTFPQLLVFIYAYWIVQKIFLVYIYLHKGKRLKNLVSNPVIKNIYNYSEIFDFKMWSSDFCNFSYYVQNNCKD